MQILAVAAEIYPLIKTGGLADVTGSLPKALKQFECTRAHLCRAIRKSWQRLKVVRCCVITATFSASRDACLVDARVVSTSLCLMRQSSLCDREDLTAPVAHWGMRTIGNVSPLFHGLRLISPKEGWRAGTLRSCMRMIGTPHLLLPTSNIAEMGISLAFLPCIIYRFRASFQLVTLLSWGFRMNAMEPIASNITGI